MLQLGVLLFAGFSVLISHRSSNFKKDGGTPQPYAFPLMAVGTCSLVLGMFLCSHIIDRSTTEETWEFEELKGARIKIAWLQLGGEVNDQLFDSHALFASKDRNQTNTLRRFAQVIIHCCLFAVGWCARFVRSTGVLSSRHYLLGAMVAKTYLQALRQLVRHWYPWFFRFLKSPLELPHLISRQFWVVLNDSNRGLPHLIAWKLFMFWASLLHGFSTFYFLCRRDPRRLKTRFFLLGGIIFSLFDSLESKPSIRRSRKPPGIKGQSSLVVLAVPPVCVAFLDNFLDCD